MTLLLTIVSASSSSSDSLFSSSSSNAKATKLKTGGNISSASKGVTYDPYDPHQRYYTIGSNYYADDPSVCSGEIGAVVSHFSRATDSADVFAWKYGYRIAVAGGCSMTFNCYADYGIEIIFKGGDSYNYINVDNVTLEIFTESVEERNRWVILLDCVTDCFQTKFKIPCNCRVYNYTCMQMAIYLKNEDLESMHYWIFF